VKASYLQKCLEKGEPFQDRSNIPPEFFYSGEEVVENWKKYGNMFLMIVSYSWLSKAHPDPELYHLKRLVPFLITVHMAYTSQGQGARGSFPETLPDFGIILDFCSLWQNHSNVEGKDSRTEQQKKEFGAGLKCIDTPYAHRDVTAIKLTGTPAAELRTYILRGWTLFESDVIDGKGVGTIPASRGWNCRVEDFAPSHLSGKIVDFGSLNVLVVEPEQGFWFYRHFCGEGFGDFRHSEFIKQMEFCVSARSAPCPPAQFCRDLEERRQNAEKLNLMLFTSGKDQPFVTKKYEATYKMMTETAMWDCSNVGVDDAYCKGLATVLPDFHIQTLKLGTNKFGAEGLAALAEALQLNQTITSLDLQSNAIGSAGAATLANTFEVNTTVTNISLSTNEIGPEGAAALSKALEVNKAITEIDLSFNSIGADRSFNYIDEGIAALAKVLEINAVITTVLLRNCRIGPEGAATLAKALRANSTIARINLFDNGIGDEGSAVLAKALEINKSIKHMDLRCNVIGNAGATAFADALKVNSTITDLDLSSNNIGAEGILCLTAFGTVVQTRGQYDP
jgi:hypothetical protein